MLYPGDPNPDDGPFSAKNVGSNLAQAPRVSQVDADELDEGLVSMLGEKVERSMGNFRVSVNSYLIVLLSSLAMFTTCSESSHVGPQARDNLRAQFRDIPIWDLRPPYPSFTWRENAEPSGRIIHTTKISA